MFAEEVHYYYGFDFANACSEKKMRITLNKMLSVLLDRSPSGFKWCVCTACAIQLKSNEKDTERFFLCVHLSCQSNKVAGEFDPS